MIGRNVLELEASRDPEFGLFHMPQYCEFVKDKETNSKKEELSGGLIQKFAGPIQQQRAINSAATR